MKFSTYLLPNSRQFDLFRIVAVGAAVGFFLLFFGSFSVESGVSTYEDWAVALVFGGHLGQGLWWRDVGYSLLLVLSGYPFTGSFVGIAIIQTAMAMAMPALVYLMLRPWFPRAAYYAALVTIISLAPFLMMKTIHHDQAYMFFMLLGLFLASRYVETGRARHLYGIALAMFVMSLIRLVGKSTFPVLLLATIVVGRRRWGHAALAAVLFAVATAGYSSYREQALDHPHSVLGWQVFYNVYTNGSVFGVKLDPADGPNVRQLLEKLRQSLEPSPAQSPKVAEFRTDPNFRAQYMTQGTAAELTQFMIDNPCNEFFNYMVDYIDVDDHVVLMASLEVALAHPLYIASYTARNLFHVLYDPGWGQARSILSSYIRTALEFPFKGGSTGGLVRTANDRAADRATDEARFIPLVRQPAFVAATYFGAEKIWAQGYQFVTHVTFFLMILTWISTLIGLLAKVSRSARVARWAEIWLAGPVLKSSFCVSAVFLVNAGMTALLVDPLYRFDFSVLTLKFILAAVGATVLLRLLSPVLVRVRESKRLPVWLTRRRGEPANGGETPGSPMRRPILSWGLLALLILVGFAGWGWSMTTAAVAVANPAPGTIGVVGATYGTNCGAPSDNAVDLVRSICGGVGTCSYVLDRRTLYSPGKCVRDFSVSWKCAPDGPITVASLPPGEADRGKAIPLSCN